MAREDDTDGTLWLACRDAPLMTGWCNAYRNDGRVCHEFASIIDRQRGGLVCAAQAPAAAADPDLTAERGS